MYARMQCQWRRTLLFVEGSVLAACEEGKARQPIKVEGRCRLVLAGFGGEAAVVVLVVVVQD
jgi:hypothetical protein